MGDFSASWLRTREPVDRRSRNNTIAAALQTAVAHVPAVKVVDIGCGTGANLRATAPLLGPEQDWTLLDNDLTLLNAGRDMLGVWANEVTEVAGGLLLMKDGKAIKVRFRQCDIAANPGTAVTKGVDLVTASAFFDLVSPAFIDTLVSAVVRHNVVFHTVLTFNGCQNWSPVSSLDEQVRRIFNWHQKGDKGFGPAAGPDAPALLRRAFDAAGYSTQVGSSPWVLGPHDADLIGQLVDGVAAAVAEAGQVPAAALASWRTVRRDRVEVGHEDLIALPPGHAEPTGASAA